MFNSGQGVAKEEVEKRSTISWEAEISVQSKGVTDATDVPRRICVANTRIYLVLYMSRTIQKLMDKIY